MKDLTDKQRRIHDMTRPIAEGGEGKTSAEIARELGISEPVVCKARGVIYRKLGISVAQSSAEGKVRGGQMSATENRRPEVAAAALFAATDVIADTQIEALDRINTELKAAGMPDKVSAALLRRLRNKYQGVVHQVRALKTGDIQKILEEKIDLAAFYLDDKVMSEANARDLGLILTAMTEKRQLLRGEPTAIISNLDREKLHALIPSMIAEARRRGVTVDGVAERVG